MPETLSPGEFSPWPIVHLDLSQELPDLFARENIGGLFLVFWWRTLPIGEFPLPASQLPMKAGALAEIAAQSVAPAVGTYLLGEGFWRPEESDAPIADALRDVATGNTALRDLDAHLSRSDDATFAARTSVVICTRDRPEALQRCLRSLQRLDPAPLEIVVIDNAPQSTATRELVSRTPKVRYVLEARPGLDIARNRGAREATGEFIAYTDDDVEVHPQWVARLGRGFATPQVWAVTGLVLPAELQTRAQWLFETEWGLNKGHTPRIFDPQWLRDAQSYGAPVWDIGAGANMAFRREVFERAGWFDERLDVGAAGCNGDSEMWYRVLAEGGACRYEPGAVVFHYHRREIANLDRQIWGYMRGFCAALLVQHERYQHRGNLRRLLLSLPRGHVRTLLAGGLSSTLRADVAGCVSGVLFYLRHRKQSRQSPTL